MILIEGKVCYTYYLDDKVSASMIWISVYHAGHAKLLQIANNTEYTLRSLERWNHKVKNDGLRGLNHQPKSGRPSSVSEVNRNLAAMLIEAGKSPGAITSQLSISYPQLRKIRKDVEQVNSPLDLNFGDDFEYE